MHQCWVPLSQMTDFIHLLEMWSFTCPFQFCSLYSGIEQSWVSQWKEELMKGSETWLIVKKHSFNPWYLAFWALKGNIHSTHFMPWSYKLYFAAALSLQSLYWLASSLLQCHFCFLSSSFAAFKFSLQSVELSADHSKAIEGFRAEHQSGLPIFSGRGRVNISATLNLFILQSAEWGSLIGWRSSS